MTITPENACEAVEEYIATYKPFGNRYSPENKAIRDKIVDELFQTNSVNMLVRFSGEIAAALGNDASFEFCELVKEREDAGHRCCGRCGYLGPDRQYVENREF